MNSSRFGRTARAAARVAAVVLVAVVTGAATWALTSHRGEPAPRDVLPQSAARTSFPDLEPATGEPTLPGLQSAAPAPGTVDTVPGPFDDRFDLDGLRLVNGTVTGTLRVTSDVSDVLDLQVLAGFYNRHGTLLATARFTHHLEEGADPHAGPPQEREQFRILAPEKIRDQVASAAVGVPVLVNE